ACPARGELRDGRDRTRIRAPARHPAVHPIVFPAESQPLPDPAPVTDAPTHHPAPPARRSLHPAAPAPWRPCHVLVPVRHAVGLRNEGAALGESVPPPLLQEGASPWGVAAGGCEPAVK